MIETALWFILGFLVAAALALAVAPALWRRAGALARQRIEATTPLTRQEIEAQVDALRAEHAMATRRLEMKAEAIKKKAAQDLVEINRQREEIARLGEACAAREEALAALQARHDDLAARLSEHEAEIATLNTKLAETERRLAESGRQVEELSRLYEEASLTASTLQVEVVAREGDIERLNDTIAALRGQVREAERARRAALSQKTEAEEALNVARARSQEMERKVEELIAAVSTRDERLERREKEIARLRQAAGQEGPDPERRLAEVEQEKARLEEQVTDLSRRIAALLDEQGADDAGGQTARKGELERLRSRLSTLMRENRRLRSAIARAEDGAGDEALREQISDLAAQVVSVAAALEGPDSPIDRALSAPQEGTGAPGGQPSLAERVRALRAGSTSPGE